MSFLYFPKEAICAFRVDFDLTKVVWNSEERRKVLKREIKKEYKGGNRYRRRGENSAISTGKLNSDQLKKWCVVFRKGLAFFLVGKM